MNIPFISTKVFEGHYPINFYFQPEAWNGQPALIGTPAIVEWVNTGHHKEVRGGRRLNSTSAYVVVGEKVFRLNPDRTATECDGTLETDSGIVQTSTDGTNIMIVDPGNAGYYVTGTTLTKIVDEDFPVPSSLTFQDEYHIVTAKDSGRFHISGQNTPSSWGSLDYKTPNGSPDFSIGSFMSHRELLVFGEESMEPYQDTGNPTFPFERLGGRYVEHGLGAINSIADFSDNVIWLADDFVVRSFSEGVPRPATPPALAAIMSGYDTKSDAFGFSFKIRGNWWYVLTFPTEDITWMMNARTGAWNQWSYGLSGGRHRANCQLYFNGTNLFGDYENGKIYELSESVFKDDGETIKRTRVTPVLFDPNNRNELTYPCLEVEFKAGVGLTTGQGSDPQAMLRYSDDGTRTWSTEEWVKTGKLGHYAHQARWDLLGKSRQRNYELSVTDPIEWVVVNAFSPVVKNRS